MAVSESQQTESSNPPYIDVAYNFLERTRTCSWLRLDQGVEWSMDEVTHAEDHLETKFTTKGENGEIEINSRVVTLYLGGEPLATVYLEQCLEVSKEWRVATMWVYLRRKGVHKSLDFPCVWHRGRWILDPTGRYAAEPE